MNVQDNRILCSIWKYHFDLIKDLEKVSGEKEFSSSYDMYRLVSFDLIRISDQISRLSSSFKEKLTSSLLGGIVGLKDILLNGNMKLEASSLYKTVNESLPLLIEEINKYGYYDILLSFLNKPCYVEIDRPLFSKHPNKKDIIYKLNYGFTRKLISPDGEYLDAYVIGENKEIDSYFGKVVAIIHRKNDIEDKIVVGEMDKTYTKEEILEKVNFQEKYFDIELIM